MNYRPNTPYAQAKSYFVSRANLRDFGAIEILTEFMTIRRKDDLAAAKFLIKMYIENFIEERVGLLHNE